MSVMLKTFAYIVYSLLSALKLLQDFNARQSLTQSALFPLPFNFFTCDISLKFLQICILFCSFCLAASSGVWCQIDNLLYILPFSHHLSTSSNDWDAQRFLIYNLLCPLFFYIDPSVLVVLHFVLFKLFSGITAQFPCLNSHTSFPSFFTVKTNKGRKPLLLESPTS